MAQMPHYVICQDIEVPTSTSPKCLVQFTVDEPQSSIVLSSELVKPFPIDFSFPDSEFISQGLRGRLIATIDGPCPATGDELAQALFAGGVTLRTIDGLVNYYPQNVTVRSYMGCLTIIA